MTWKLSIIIHGMVWAVLFGAGVVFAVSTSYLSQYGGTVLYGWAFLAFLISWPISWVISRRILQKRGSRAALATYRDQP